MNYYIKTILKIKRRAMISYFFIFIFIGYSCEKEKDDNPGVTTGELLCSNTWNLNYYHYNNGDTVKMPSDELTYVHYKFNNDSTLKMEEQLPKLNNMVAIISYTWFLSENTLKLTGDYTFTFTISKIDTQSLELNLKNDLNNLTYVFSRLE